MNPCKACKGVGKLKAGGYNCHTVCPACSGTGKVRTTGQDKTDRPEVLAQVIRLNPT